MSILSLILQLLESPFTSHTTIQVSLNHDISSKYSEEVPIRIDSHSEPVQVNQAFIVLMCLCFILHLDGQKLSPHLFFLPFLSY